MKRRSFERPLLEPKALGGFVEGGADTRADIGERGLANTQNRLNRVFLRVEFGFKSVVAICDWVFPA
jgi:hypothetical protein